MRAPRTTALLALAAALAVLAGACGPEWRPVTYLDKLRVLAVRAEPPDLAPGDAAALSALVLTPRDPGQSGSGMRECTATTCTLAWFACDPDPTTLDQPACAKFANLDDAADLAAPGTQTLPEGIRLLGLGQDDASPVKYFAPAGLFDALAPEDPRRTKGVLAYVLLLAVAAPPPASDAEMNALMQRVRNKEVDSLIALKRIRVSGEAARNHNPVALGLRFGDELWKGSGQRPVKLRPGQSYALTGVAAEGCAERYVQLDADGAPVEKDEKLMLSWFSTAGLFEAPRSPEADPIQEFSVAAPFETLPEDRRGTMFAVMRDGRGGTDWLKRGFFVCDPFLEAPTLTSVEPAAAPARATVTLRGSGLKDVLDVQLGEFILAGLSYDAASGTLTGTVPSDAAPGAGRLVARGKSCRPDPELTFEVAAP